MNGPLDGVRIVDFSAVVSGPFATMWLSDQGADVIKIESAPFGDITRGLRANPELDGMAGLYTNCNRGKRSVAIDVNTVDGREAVLELCRSADVFIQNWRPGVVDRLGLGYDDVRAVRPDIVYVSISGFGPTGPYAQRRVYDPVIQGLTGHVAVQVNPEMPIPDLVRTIVCDKATALTAAQSICAALFARERGAGGQHLIIPMLDVGMAFFFPDGYMGRAWLDDPKAPQRNTLARTYRLQPTLDGHLIYFAASDPEFHGLFRALGHPEWVDDPRFDTPGHRLANLAELGELIGDAFGTWTTEAISVRLEAEDVPFGPILGFDELPNDAQLIHNETLTVVDDPVLGRLLGARHPVRFSATPTAPRAIAPRLGADTEQVLTELRRF